MLIRDMPKIERTSAYADLGTAAHELAEMVLRARKKKARAFLGKSIEVGDNVYEVDHEMADAVQVYLDDIYKTVAKVEKSGGGQKPDITVESKFDLGHLGWPTMFGTNDASLVEEWGALYVWDYKHGQGVPVPIGTPVDPDDLPEGVSEREVVEACIYTPRKLDKEEWGRVKPSEAYQEVEGPSALNQQLMYYALGAVHGTTCEEVVITVVQPRSNGASQAVRRARLDREELERWGKDFLIPSAERTQGIKAVWHVEEGSSGLAKSLHRNGHLVPGEVQCRWCNAKPICPANYEYCVQSMFGDLGDVDTEDLDAALTQKRLEELRERVRKLPLERMGAILRAKPAIQALLKDVEEVVRDYLQTGVADPEQLGHKLVLGKRTRSWGPKGKAFLVTKLKQDAWKNSLITPKQAEILFKAKDLPLEALYEHVATARSRALVPIEAPGDPIEPMFEDLGDSNPSDC